MKPIFITGHGSISSLGADPESIEKSYLSPLSLAALTGGAPTFPLSTKTDEVLKNWCKEHVSEAEKLDRVIQLALFSSARAVESAKWSASESNDALVQVGTARGATDTIEKTFCDFRDGKRLGGSTSPRTTLGGIASSIAGHIGSEALSSGTSMTCASFMQALLCSIAFLESGRSARALVCGAEAPLTAYTIAQMKALRIYSGITEPFPCRPLSPRNEEHSSMVLGEGAASFTIETEEALSSRTGRAIARIAGISAARENNETPTGMEPEGHGLRKTMQAALQEASLSTVDAIIVHAPGTRMGDASELSAIDALFSERPSLFSTKYLTGHTFGASAALSLELALLLLNNSHEINFPYDTGVINSRKIPVQSVLINSAGFGGVNSSVIITSC